LTYTSDVLTNRAREQAGNNISDVYSTLDLSIGRSQLAHANAIFNFIGTVRADNQARLDEKVDYLQAVEDVIIDESVAADLLTMSQSDYDTARTEILRIIDDLMREEIRENNVEEFQRSARRQASLGLTPAQGNAVTNMAWQFIVPTIFLDATATSAAREAAASDIEPVTRSVVKDQRIMRAGEIVTEADVELLTQVGLLNQETDWTFFVSIFLMALLSVALITFYWRWFIDKLHDNGRYLILLAGLILFFTAIAKGVNAAEAVVLPYLFPIAALSLLIAVIFDVRFSILITVIMGGILGLTTPNSLEMTLYAAVGGLLAILTLRDAQRIVAIFQAGLMAAVGHIAVMWMFGLQSESDLFMLVQQSLYGLGCPHTVF